MKPCFCFFPGLLLYVSMCVYLFESMCLNNTGMISLAEQMGAIKKPLQHILCDFEKDQAGVRDALRGGW